MSLWAEAVALAADIVEWAATEDIEAVSSVRGIEAAGLEVGTVVLGLAVDTVAVGYVSGTEQRVVGRWTVENADTEAEPAEQVKAAVVEHMGMVCSAEELHIGFA